MTLPFGTPIEPMLTKLQHEIPCGRGLALRVEVGRVPRARVPRRRRVQLPLHPTESRIRKLSVAAGFVRWRTDEEPRECTFEQLRAGG